MSHSPGPWHVEAEQWTSGRREVVCSGEHIVAVILPEEFPDDEDWDGTDEHLTKEDRANSALIAAAPDLLKACIELIAICEHGRKDGGFIPWISLGKAEELAIEAVNKAKGVTE